MLSFSGWMRFRRESVWTAASPTSDLVDVHRVQQRLVEAGLELLGHDQHAVVGGRELLRRRRLGEAVHVGSRSAGIPVPSSIFPENATSVLMSA